MSFADDIIERDKIRPERPPGVWTLRYDGFEPEGQGLREALCALGNGYFVTRGALPEAQADGINYPGTYVAGLYNRLQTAIAGRTVENEDLVNLPNWLALSFQVDGRALVRYPGRPMSSIIAWNSTSGGGCSPGSCRWQEPDGRRTRMVQRRFVSMKDSHLAGLQTTFTAENWSGTLNVRSGVDGRIVNSGVKRYHGLNSRHLKILRAARGRGQTVELQAETSQSHVRIAVAARTRLLADGVPVAGTRHLVAEPGAVGHALAVTLEKDRPVTVEKIAALYTSRDRAISESLLARPPGRTGRGPIRRPASHGTRTSGTHCGTASTSGWTAATSGPR